MSKPTDEDLITAIEAIRSRNNTRWMDLVRLAFREAPEEARAIMADVVENDQRVAVLSKQLAVL